MPEEEFAPGIPDRDLSHDLPQVDDAEIWEYAVQAHEAERAGRHFDLRLGDPRSGFAHSWALRHWPSPGEKRLAVKQPTHTLEYMNYEGPIAKGYGKGQVVLHERDKTEVIRSEPKKISFNLYKGTKPEEFSLVQTKDGDWLLLNRTPTREKSPDLPTSKPKYVDREISVDDDNEVMQAKLDGAHNLVVLPRSGRYPRFMSYRQGKKSDTGIIEHTHKVPNYDKILVPAKLRDTILRGEMYATGPTGRAVRSTELAGLLNANVWKSRAKQDGAKTPLRTAIFDVVKYKGKNVEGWPYGVKLEILDEIAKEIPYLELPPMAKTPAEKKKLFEAIMKGQIPETKEGVVAWNLSTGAPPARFKLRPDHDVFIRGFFDATPGSKYEGRAVGGFLYSHTPDGPIAGRVGTGLSDELRQKMFADPDLYLGSVAKVKSQERYDTGALRAPSFSEWHLDKNDPDFLKYAEAFNISQLIAAVAQDMWNGSLP